MQPNVLELLSTLLLGLGVAWTWLSIHALQRRKPRPTLDAAEPITVLKPLRGVDAALHENLRSFFVQDYPSFELVFGVEGADDPALSVVAALRRQHPHVRVRVVVHRGGSALNPKVRNLLAMLRDDTHDVLLISDANIRVKPGYLRNALAALQQPGTGLVTHPIAGDTDRSASVATLGDCGARIEQGYLTCTVVPAIAVANDVLGHAAVIGKSMMFRRSVLDGLGGLASLSNVLAEDYVMGRMFQHAGHRIHLAHDAVINTSAQATVPATLDRMVRWSMLRARVQPLAYVFEGLTSPLVLALLAALSSWRPLALACVLTLWVVRDWAALRRVDDAFHVRTMILAPLREALWLCAWCLALGRRHVRWRGHRLRVSAGTLLYRTGDIAS